MDSIWLGWLLIFSARIADMTLATLRTLFLVRGHSWQAGSIGFVEALLYIVALNQVFRHLDSFWSFLFYAGGFACGNILGSYLEEKLAIGYLVVQVISDNAPDMLAEKLRAAGFGVTVWDGEGLEGRHQILNVVIRRRDRCKVLSIISSCDENAFVSVSDARTRQGGFFSRKKEK